MMTKQVPRAILSQVLFVKRWVFKPTLSPVIAVLLLEFLNDSD